MMRWVVLLGMVVAAARAEARVVLPTSNLTLSVDGWTVSAGDPLLVAGDVLTDPAGHQVEVRIIPDATCATHAISYQRGGWHAHAVSLTVAGYASPIYSGDTAFGGSAAPGYHLCLERERSFMWVMVHGEIDPPVRALLDQLRTASNADSPVRRATGRIDFAASTHHGLRLARGADWKYRFDGEMLLVEDLRAGDPGWSIGIRPTPPDQDCDPSGTTERVPGLPSPAIVERATDDEGVVRSVKLLSCFSKARSYGIILLARREPTTAEISAIVDEVLTRGIVEDVHHDAPRLTVGVVGIALASSAPISGGSRGFGPLFAGEVAGIFYRPIGIGFDGGVETGYAYHGAAAELRATAGLGIRVGSFGLILGVGGIVSLLGEADAGAGDFTRHAGGMASTRILVGGEDRSFTAGVSTTYGLNADQLRGEIGISSKPYAFHLRVIQHGDLGADPVARTVLVVGGLGW